MTFCCERDCTSCATTNGKPCTACYPGCPCLKESKTPEMVLALDILTLRERLGRDWLAETDGPPSTREVFDRLTAWAKKTVENS